MFRRSKAKKESHARQSHSLGTITTPSQSAGVPFYTLLLMTVFHRILNSVINHMGFL